MPEHPSSEKIQRALSRRVQNIFPSSDEAIRRLSGTEPLTFYLGIDPTGPLHIGHLIPLLVLDDLRVFGHRVTILLGDFTARIGDPTEKNSARIALTPEEVHAHMEGYLDILARIIPRDAFTVAYNSEWLASMSLEQVLLLTSKTTVQQMIARDMFQERLKNEKPIFISEFLYPLLQGYDSVALQVDGEVGGNDQTFNMLMGRDLSRDLLGKDKLVIATRLLIDEKTGKKMSKSEGSLIALTDSPQEIRRKVLEIDDGMTKTFFELCTRREQEWINQESAKVDPRQFKEELVEELVRMLHGAELVAHAREAVKVIAGPLDHVLVAAGIATSISSAHNLINEGAVRINDETVKEWKKELINGDRVRIGRGKFLEIGE